MNIFITCPAIQFPHGGIRVILEWANRLTAWHDVTLFVEKESDDCQWFKISNKVNVTFKQEFATFADCIIITSPHSIRFQYYSHTCGPQKCFLFMQMAEHLFTDKAEWQSHCQEFYRSTFPMFCISRWNMDVLRTDFGRQGVIHYIGNGVNFDDFPLEPACIKDEKTVLVEGWESTNRTKDVQHLAAKVAEQLKKEGYTILAYSSLPIRRRTQVPHEYYVQPDLETLNSLYRRASVLIKVSKYDARSCAPVEAMTKGTVTVRGIIKGDDDLTSEVNSLCTDYNAIHVYRRAKQLLENRDLLTRLRKNCLQYVQQNCDWDYWMQHINKILIE